MLLNLLHCSGMATLTSQTLTKGVLELTISIAPTELGTSLERGAADLQRTHPLAGFRPGKAPVAEVKKTLGEMKLLEAAIKYAAPTAYVQVIKDNHLLTIGEPDIEVTAIIPGQPIIFTAHVAVMPEVKLGDYKKIKVKENPVVITEKDVDELIEELCTMRATYSSADKPAEATDRIIIDLNMFVKNVPIEGGQAKDHAVDLNKPYFVPGFTEKLIGLTTGAETKFTLPFPTEHYQKTLAGQDVDFVITVKDVQKITRPEINDAFAASIGKFETLSALKEQINHNLIEVKRGEEDARIEREIITELSNKTKFGDIPELLVTSEVQKLIARLQERIQKDGGTLEQYLEHIKQTPAELAQSLAPEATTRVQAALIVRAVSEAENIEVNENEIETEREKIIGHYHDDPEMQKELRGEEYGSHLKHLLMTRKVMSVLKDIATK